MVDYDQVFRRKIISQYFARLSKLYNHWWLGSEMWHQKLRAKFSDGHYYLGVVELNSVYIFTFDDIQIHILALWGQYSPVMKDKGVWLMGTVINIHVGGRAKWNFGDRHYTSARTDIFEETNLIFKYGMFQLCFITSSNCHARFTWVYLDGIE